MHFRLDAPRNPGWACVAGIYGYVAICVPRSPAWSARSSAGDLAFRRKTEQEGLLRRERRVSDSFVPASLARAGTARSQSTVARVSWREPFLLFSLHRFAWVELALRAWSDRRHAGGWLWRMLWLLALGAAGCLDDGAKCRVQECKDVINTDSFCADEVCMQCTPCVPEPAEFYYGPEDEAADVSYGPTCGVQFCFPSSNPVHLGIAAFMFFFFSIWNGVCSAFVMGSLDNLAENKTMCAVVQLVLTFCIPHVAIGIAIPLVMGGPVWFLVAMWPYWLKMWLRGFCRRCITKKPVLEDDDVPRPVIGTVVDNLVKMHSKSFDGSTQGNSWYCQGGRSRRRSPFTHEGIARLILLKPSQLCSPSPSQVGMLIH